MTSANGSPSPDADDENDDGGCVDEADRNEELLWGKLEFGKMPEWTHVP